MAVIWSTCFTVVTCQQCRDVTTSVRRRLASESATAISANCTVWIYKLELIGTTNKFPQHTVEFIFHSRKNGHRISPAFEVRDSLCGVLKNNFLLIRAVNEQALSIHRSVN